MCYAEEYVSLVVLTDLRMLYTFCAVFTGTQQLMLKFVTYVYFEWFRTLSCIFGHVRTY